MELSISQSSLRLPTSIPQRCMVYFHEYNRVVPIKPTTNNIKSSNFLSKFSTKNLILPLGLYGENKFSKSLLYGRDTRNTTRVYAESKSGTSDITFDKVKRFGSACYNFTRPHSTYHAIVSTICLFARVLAENPQLFKWSLLFKSFPGLIAVMLLSFYYNGINQIYDVDIDRVNKPHLPIPAGDLSLKQAWIIVTFDILASMFIVRLMNADNITTFIYFLIFLCCTFYSAPPLRFKESSIATSILNPLMGGILQNVGILYATRASLGLPFKWSPPTLFIVSFTTFFFMVITNIKDLSDVEGDIKHNIQTFPAIYGARKVTFLCTGILLVNYIGSMVASICMPQVFKPSIMVPAHTVLSLWLLAEARKLDKANYTKEKSANFFFFLWKLLRLEYLLYPFV